MTRRRLPNRRLSEVFEFKHVNPETRVADKHVATIGFYEDGEIGEIFIDTVKNESMMGILCHDAAVLISIALQNGATIEEMKNSVARTKNDAGAPQSVIGSVLDALARRQAEINAG